MKIKNLAVIVTVLLMSFAARATEIYSIVQNDCKVHSGLILDADPDTISLMSLNGESLQLKREDIKSLTIFNTIENPIPNIQMRGENRERLREISIDSQETPYLTGWPVRFVEELVIFYDITGKTYVLNFDRMTRVRRVHKTLPVNVTTSGNAVNLELSESLGSCPHRPAAPGVVVRPTRIISDKIQLSEMINSFVTGFDSMESFEERTYLYALPFLYERNTRMGFISNDAFLEQPKMSGFYFQWSRGRPYRFQSSYKVGTFPMRYAPSAENFLGVSTELKSHLFHAAFTGNLPALSAGSTYYSNNVDQLTRNPSTTERAHFAPGFNYMALMGADYGAWSGSFGTYFPIFLFIADNSMREILASKVQAIFRVMYTAPSYQAMLLYSRGQVGKNGGMTDREMQTESNDSVLPTITSFDLSYDYLNADFTYRFNKELSAGLQVIMVKGNYQERNLTAAVNSFAFDHTTFVANVRHQFGDYVSLSATARFYSQKEDFNFASASRSEPLTRTVFGGVFEFIF